MVANFVPGNFGLFQRNPWQPLAEPRLKNTDISQHVARLPIATENVDQKDKSLPGTELMHARRSNINER